MKQHYPLNTLAALIAMLGCRSELAIPPTPTRWVTDGPSCMSEPVRLALDDRLREYQARTGHQVIVWIDKALPHGESIENFGLVAFNTWGIGREGRDDGVVLFVFTASKLARIQVGYGLEHKLTDREAARILGEIVVPAMARGAADTALTDGVAAILAVIEGPIK